MVNAMRYLDLKLTLGGDILVKIDRASMAVSLEVRPVYLHRDMVALAGTIPPCQLASRTESKTVLKSALRPWLPDAVLYRKKMGFAMPLPQWINGELRQMGVQNHSESPFEDLLEPALLEHLMRTHATGHVDLTSRIHSLFFLKLWLLTWA